MSKAEELAATLNQTRDASGRKILRAKLEAEVARERAVSLAGLAAELSR